MKHYDKFYIDGRWVEPAGSTPFELINPATETPFATVSLGTSEDVDRAVAAARRAFASFGSTSPAERVALLERVVQAIRAREDDIMDAVTAEMGAPRSLTAHVTTAIAAFSQALATLRD